MARRDHCFLLRLADGRSGMAFCPEAGIGGAEARLQVERALASRTAEQISLAYLGVLDYRSMDPEAAEMVDGFERLDPVWLGFFCPRTKA